MKWVFSICVSFYLLAGCTIPTPKPSNAEMQIQQVPTEWLYLDANGVARLDVLDNVWKN